MYTNGNDSLENVKQLINNYYTEIENPLLDNAFAVSDNEKINLITEKFEDILTIIGLDLTDDSLKNTPQRIAKMYINEIFKGLNPKNRPKITLFKNKYSYQTPLIERNIPFTSFCEHHFVPINGIANVAYIPKDYVIGLSKIHRLIDFYARRPQVQERLTLQIVEDLSKTLQTKDIGVVLKASHSCISCRGVEDIGSSTITSSFLGKIMANNTIISELYK